MSKLAHSHQPSMDEIERRAADECDGPRLVIKTSNIFPPIPVRQFDWCAWYDGREEGPQGYGATEQAAIRDLIDNYDAPEA